MENNNFLSFVSNKLKHEYQEGTVSEVEIKCADGKSIWAHECVLAFHSAYLRMTISKARESQASGKPIQLDFTTHSEKATKYYLDMMYQVNREPLGINGSIQMIDMLNDAGLYDHATYPWHAQMIDREVGKLEKKIGGLPKKKLVDVVVGLGRIPISPIIGVINHCLADFKEDEFSMWLGSLFMETEMFGLVVANGINFISETDYSCQMICHYLSRTKQEISKENVQKEIFQIAKSVFEQQNEPTVPNDEPSSTINTIQQSVTIQTDSDALWEEFEFISQLTGSSGPTLENCIGYYEERHSWVTTKRHFFVHDGAQIIAIPKTGKYQITAYGAGMAESHGAIVSATVELKLGDALKIIVGQQPNDKFTYIERYRCRLSIDASEIGLLNHSGCGATFVGQLLHCSTVPNKTLSELKLLVVAGGAGSGPKKAFTHARITKEASGNFFVGSNGTPTVASGYYKGNTGSGVLDNFKWDKHGLHGKELKYTKLVFRHQENVREYNPDFNGGFGGGGYTTISRCELHSDHDVCDINCDLKVMHGCGGGYTGGGYAYDSKHDCTGGGGGSFSIDKS